MTGEAIGTSGKLLLFCINDAPVRLPSKYFGLFPCISAGVSWEEKLQFVVDSGNYRDSCLF